MASEAVLRYSLVFLGALVLGIGIYTMSFKKMIATYVFGILAISGVLLPDWEFFDRDFSQWLTPMPARDRSAPAPAPQPLRTAMTRLLLNTLHIASLNSAWAMPFRVDLKLKRIRVESSTCCKSPKKKENT